MEWVETIEPESGQIIYANPVTGEVTQQVPPGAIIKPMTENQWLAFYDESSQDYYYHNPHTNETVWDKPPGADIVCLASLQNVSEATDSNTEQHSTPTESFTEPSNDNGKPEELPPVTTSPDLTRPLDVLSPIDMEFNGHSHHEQQTHRFTMFSNEAKEHHQSENHHHDNHHHDDSHHDNDNPLHPDDDMSRLDSTKSTSSVTDESSSTATSATDVSVDQSPKPRDNSSTVNATKSGSVSSTDSKTASLPRPSGHDHQYKDHKSGSRAYHTIERGSTGPNYTAHHESLKVNDSIKSGGGRPSSLTHTIPEDSSVMEPFKTRLDSYLVVSMNDVSNDPSSNPRRGSSGRKASSPAASPLHVNNTATLDNLKKPHKTDGIPSAPALPPSKTGTKMKRSVSMQADLGKYNELAQHKKGFFRRKVTIANMLAWTKDPIKQPMILTRDKELRKESLELFKLVLQCMGDKKVKGKTTPDSLILEITSRCWAKKGLRDELFVQLCRQTTSNPKAESLRRGWELITVGLHFFPPSVKFRGYLEGYLWKHIEPESDFKGIPVSVYAQYCHKRIEKMTQWGAKKGVKKPTMEEILYAKTTPFHMSMFGTTLEEVMELQKEQFPSYDIPWVIVELCDTVLHLRGPHTQGIFRIPGDIDEVNSLKVHVEQGKSIPSSLSDPHIPASLLKLWFRELEDPLIPENYYQSCIDNCDNPNNVLSLADSLPLVNRRVLYFIVDFLQKFITPESSEQTKMGIDNIAMVWAPNFLRCPSDDHVLIFENTRREMTFVRLLLKHYHHQDTS